MSEVPVFWVVMTERGCNDVKDTLYSLRQLSLELGRRRVGQARPSITLQQSISKMEADSGRGIESNRIPIKGRTVALFICLNEVMNMLLNNLLRTCYSETLRNPTKGSNVTNTDDIGTTSKVALIIKDP